MRDLTGKYLCMHSEQICIRSKSIPASWNARTSRSPSRRCIWVVSLVELILRRPANANQKGLTMFFCQKMVHELTVFISVHLPNRAVSPRKIFMITVSAMSSALCPVAIQSTSNVFAPRSRAWRRNTPQNVQLFDRPISPTILSIVQPYSSSYDSIFNGIW